VPVCFEVHAHVEALRDRVQVLDPGRRAPGLESERLLRVVPYKNSSPVS
jgi:predicted HTH transcriptional regulator